MIRPQGEFPLLKEYKKQFEITDETIFALSEDIFTNFDLTSDLIVHENTHLEQQAKVGIKEWVYDFLYNPARRLQYEIEAYKKQLKSIKDRNHRARVRVQSAKNLSSDLYGNIVSYQDALDVLK